MTSGGQSNHSQADESPHCRVGHDAGMDTVSRANPAALRSAAPHQVSQQPYGAELRSRTKLVAQVLLHGGADTRHLLDPLGAQIATGRQSPAECCHERATDANTQRRQNVSHLR